jgi:hypothetical protein
MDLLRAASRLTVRPLCACPSGSERAAARAAGSLRRFRVQSESCDGHPGRRSKRLEAASAVKGADVVLSTDFGRLSRTEPKVHRGGTEPAAARAAESLRRLSTRAAPRDRQPGRRSKRLEAASAEKGAPAVLFIDFGRVSRTEPTVHRGGTETAPARAPWLLRRLSTRAAPRDRQPGRRSKRLEAASAVKDAPASAFHRFRPSESHGADSASR